jgi:hypothetical protein
MTEVECEFHPAQVGRRPVETRNDDVVIASEAKQSRLAHYPEGGVIGE